MMKRASAILSSIVCVMALQAVYARDPHTEISALPVKDAPYPGAVQLSVDLRNVRQRVFRIHENIPVHAGELLLLYPKWIPGEHGPTGTLDGVTGIKFTAAGQPVPWRRDLREMFALHVTVPERVDHLELDFQFLSPGSGGLFGQSVSVTERLVDLEWNQVLFYPAGYAPRQIIFEPTVLLPEDWMFASALERAAGGTGETRFQPVSLETLVDSPLIAGKFFRRFELAGGNAAPVALNVVADREENLAVTAAQLQQLAALVPEAAALFGAHHYRHYDFLFTVSDDTGHFGLEHHQSSDDRYYANFFNDPNTYLIGGALLPHEYVHSWNGKFRRPADLAIVDFKEPMQDDLLWVYEGLTNYWGEVLAARAGLLSPDQYREMLAYQASQLNHTPGRSWRPLQDTADEAQILYNVAEDWMSWRRRTDFYAEGSLLWLDIDTKLRQLSDGKRSLDDFARLFFGIEDGSMAVHTYVFDDIAATLNRVQPNDWAAFLRARLNATTVDAPLDGLTRGGWKIVYDEQPGAYCEARDKVMKQTNLTESLGVLIDEDADKRPGNLLDVRWGSPAFAAGAAPGMLLVAVNGTRYSDETLKQAIQAAKGQSQPIELLLRSGGTFLTVQVDYHGGLSYPHLQRLDNAPDRLSQIIAARRR
jgi:predicted metalloprotease with PDZ domain